VIYELAASDVADLMRAARRFLSEVLADQRDLLAELQLADRPAVRKRRK
jgi:ArsR family transcriptional regulator